MGSRLLALFSSFSADTLVVLHKHDIPTRSDALRARGIFGGLGGHRATGPTKHFGFGCLTIAFHIVVTLSSC